MTIGYISNYFEMVAGKYLSAVDINPGRSNQHEIGGIGTFTEVLGRERKELPAILIYFGENEEDTVRAEVSVTWYDARRNQPLRSPEYRLYYPSNEVMQSGSEGDSFIIAQKADDTLLIIIARSGSTFESHLSWLFGVSPGKTFSFREYDNKKDIELGFAARYILDEIGIETEYRNENFLDIMLDRFGGRFPSTREFSSFSRVTIPDVISPDDPDQAFMMWFEQEELLFRTLERHIVAKRLAQGFGDDVDEFIKFSLSVLNRRKSRVGHAFENHLEQIFTDQQIRYSNGPITENRAKPDFIFPSIANYKNTDFPAALLTMLAVKSTCKDRWRQVLSEAARIENKHLITLEPGISVSQTNEMKSHSLQLIVPALLHETYKSSQQDWLMNIREFTDMVKERQKKAFII